MAELLHNGEDILALIRKKKMNNEIEIKQEIFNFTGILLRELMIVESIMDKIMMFQHFDKLPEADKSKILMDNFIKTLKEMVYNISRDLHKEVDFQAVNTLNEFPYLDKLKSSIIHLVRNSIDHGIEDKFERLSKNKNQKGLIKLKFYKDDRDYFIEVSDDGGNINLEKIKQKAVEKNIIKLNDSSLTKEKLISLIFSPDFSSKDHVTDLSGRGIGLDVVKKDIEKLHGRIHVTAKEHLETKFTLVIPIIKKLDEEKVGNFNVPQKAFE
jgi:signal transduction histidine kinase